MQLQLGGLKDDRPLQQDVATIRDRIQTAADVHLPDVSVIGRPRTVFHSLAVLTVATPQDEPDRRVETLLYLFRVDAPAPEVIRILQRGAERAGAARDAGLAVVQEPP